MTEETKVVQELHGRVKWFDPAKGFGFIVAEGVSADILLHANVLRNYGQSSVADGAGIFVRVQMTQRGAQAVEVLGIDPPATAIFALGEDAEAISIEELADHPLEAARVKWFDKAKGFGFGNVFGRPEDVFIHIEVLRHSGFADLAIGEALCLRIVEGPRGLMAAQIAAWDAAQTAHDEKAQAESLHNSLPHVAE